MKLSGVVAFAALAVWLAPARAQDWRAGTGRLEGRVLDAAGNPLGGALVRLELPGRGGTELHADRKGRWAILGLTGGEWVVEISAPGYVTRRVALPVAEQSRRPVHEARLEEATGASPEAVEALEKAETAQAEGRLAEARAEYEKLRALRPDLGGRIDQQIGVTYVREKDYARALDHLLKALGAEPDSVPLRAAAAQAAFEAEERERGRELLAGLAVERVDDPDMAFTFGIDLVNAGAAGEAVLWFTRAIALDAGYVDGYYRRALALLQLGEAAQSRADFEKVLRLAPGTPQGEMARQALEQVRQP